MERDAGMIRQCRHGHVLDGRRKRGQLVGWYCRTCNVETNRRWRARQRKQRALE